MLTWYSAMPPSRMSTRCSLIHALRTLRSVLVARATPCWMASSKLFDDVELISVTRATAIGLSSLYREPDHVRTDRTSGSPDGDLQTRVDSMPSIGIIR